MTYKLPRTGISSLGKHEAAKPRVFFTLYRKGFDKVWRRVSLSQFYSQRLAWNVFESQLIKEPLSLSIRPCKITCEKAQGKPSKRCSKHAGIHWNPAKEMLSSGNTIEYIGGQKVKAF